ncbi:MAG: hypothetical protein AAF928_04335 [Myxococcota bacterium]
MTMPTTDPRRRSDDDTHRAPARRTPDARVPRTEAGRPFAEPSRRAAAPVGARGLVAGGLAAALATTLAVGPAFADEASSASSEDAASVSEAACPPGAFCEATEVAPPPSAVEEEEVTEGTDGIAVEGDEDAITIRVPPPEPGSKDTRVIEVRPDPDGGPAQVIIYERGKPGADAPKTRGAVIDAPPPPPKARRKRVERHRKWGMNLRVNGVLLPRDRDDVSSDAGMAGLGFSMRYRPTPAFAVDFSTDFIGGIDANGLERQELPLGMTAMVYVNPQSVAQFYLLAGMNLTFARVFSDIERPNLRDAFADDYTYFGGHGGLGLEFRVAPLVGINVDGLAFIRGRTDDDGDGLYPEYFNPDTGEVSNTSVAGLLRAGITFWW